MGSDSSFNLLIQKLELQTENASCEIRGVADRILRKREPGDHIYTWRGTSREIHHGIYVGDEKVIHFKCSYQKQLHGVVCSSIDKFLSGGDLYIFKYNVNPARLLAKLDRDTCTIASADEQKFVVKRALFLLENSSVDYHPYIKNCYDFAIYCKTGSITYSGINVSRNEPVSYTLVVTALVFFCLLQQMPPSFTALAASCLAINSICRLALDIGVRPNVIKVQVDKFAEVERLASECLGFQRTIWFLFKVGLLALICAFISLACSMWSYQSRRLVWTLAGIKFLYWLSFQRKFESRWVFTNKIRKKKQLKLGDHIYTWRNGYSYAHHGIYAGKKKVIHLTRREGPIIGSFSPPYNPDQEINGSGDYQSRRDRVEMCSIDTFLSGGEIYLYDYGVDLAFFIAKSRGGTCTLAHSDPPGLVLHRASFLVEKGFGAYNLFYNNCEDFAIYCKTGLLVPRIITLGRSGQTTAFAALICAFISIPYSLLTGSNLVGVAVVGYVLYSIWRLFSDTGYCRDARKVAVQELAAFQTFIDFMRQQLMFSLIPKFICYAILIRAILFPGAAWPIRSQNCLLDWIVTVAILWVAFF